MNIVEFSKQEEAYVFRNQTQYNDFDCFIEVCRIKYEWEDNGMKLFAKFLRLCNEDD